MRILRAHLRLVALPLAPFPVLGLLLGHASQVSLARPTEPRIEGLLIRAEPTHH